MKIIINFKYAFTLLVFTAVFLLGCELSESNNDEANIIYKSNNIKVFNYFHSDSIKSFNIEIYDNADTFCYNRLIKKDEGLIQDGYLKNGKKTGPTSLYKNGRIVIKYAYKNDLPIFREDYLYHQETGLLDSIIGRVVVRKEPGVGDVSFPIGGVSFKNGQIDTLHSRYYSFSQKFPFVKSSRASIAFKIDLIGMKKDEYALMIIGELDSINYYISSPTDTTLNSKPYFTLRQLSSNFTGVLEMEGNLFFCNEEKGICYERIPFYNPVYFMKPEIYDELDEVLSIIKWSDSWE